MSPGKAVLSDPAQWGRLERYVKDILETFGEDERVLMWDLYNEPGNWQTREISFHDVVLEKDEGNRPTTTLEGLAGLKPVRDNGFITAGNASQLSDGASAAVMSRKWLIRCSPPEAGDEPPATAIAMPDRI